MSQSKLTIESLGYYDTSEETLAGQQEDEDYSKNALIIDIGSTSLKIKNMKTDEWKVIPAYLTKSSRTKFGQEAIIHSKRRRGRHPIAVLKNGVVEDWKKMEKFLKLVFKETLRGKAVMVCEPVPTTDNMNAARDQRKRLAKLLVQACYVEAYYVAPQPTLSIMAFPHISSLKAANGVVIDIGSATTTVTVVYRGETISRCTQHSLIGGHLFDQMIMKKISERSGTHINTDIFEACKIKERICFVSNKISEDLVRARKQDKKFLRKIRMKEELQGKEIELDSERFCVPELLFDVSSINCGYRPEQTLPLMVKMAREQYENFRADQLRRGNLDYDNESSQNLFNQYYIVGGCTKMEGMLERIQREVKQANVEYEVSVSNLTPEEFQDLVQRSNVNFNYKKNESKRGKEPIEGASKVVKQSSPGNWVRAIEITEEGSNILLSCPR